MEQHCYSCDLYNMSQKWNNIVILGICEISPKVCQTEITYSCNAISSKNRAVV